MGSGKNKLFFLNKVRSLFFKYLFIYFWLCQVLVEARGICSMRDLLLQHADFSLAVARRLSSCGVRAL